MSITLPVRGRHARRRATYIPAPVRLSAVNVTAATVGVLVVATSATAAVLPFVI